MTASRMRPSRIVAELLDAVPEPATEVLMDMVGLSGRVDQCRRLFTNSADRRHIVHRTYISIWRQIVHIGYVEANISPLYPGCVMSSGRTSRS